MKRRNGSAWRVHRGDAGQLVILTADGQPVFRQAERLARVRAVYLAASAPELYAALDDLAGRLERLGMAYRLDYRDRVRVQSARAVLMLSWPPADVDAEAAVPQQELFDAAA